MESHAMDTSRTTTNGLSAHVDEIASRVRALVRSTPIIDNHAHPLLRLNAASKPSLLSITTEADGQALDATPTSLAHIRAVRQLSGVLGCNPTWDDVRIRLEQKRSRDYEGWVRTCLSGIRSVLVDDLIGQSSDNESYEYFDKFTPASAKRIVRIESVAEELLAKVCREHVDAHTAFGYFTASLDRTISGLVRDSEVAGFKSVVCYRTGLDVAEKPCRTTAFEAFKRAHSEISQADKGGRPRLEHDGLNQYVVHLLASNLGRNTSSRSKPIQFHTGLGDSDITLTKASPSYLQPFIKQYPNVPIVLLHSGYPFVREMGYLASVYANVYADIGEVFPMVSRDGQEAIIRQILELCPSSKIMWSTDGHCFPERFLLAVTQMREAFETVLCEYVQRGDLDYDQVKECVERILFYNANNLYGLGECDSSSLTPLTPQSEVDLTERDSDKLKVLLDSDSSIQYIRIAWVDITGLMRTRIIPRRRAMALTQSENGFKLSISKAALAVLQNDHLIEGIGPSGEWLLRPAFSTLRPLSHGHYMAMAEFVEKKGSAVEACPRSQLRRTLEHAAHYGLTFIFGFEIEFVLLDRSGAKKFQPLGSDSHAWCTMAATDRSVPAMAIIEEAVAQLDDAGIYIETVHPESAPGQYEIVLPAAPALEAVDAVIYARQILASCANARGCKMTLHPKPSPDAAGTAAHVHMSISSKGGSDPNVYEPFYAGILKHLRSIIAYTCASPVSYERIVDGYWAGGTWVTWGTQNRETPLRKVEDSHWEVKCMDGIANPYLAMSAIIASGLEGVLTSQQMLWKECVNDPATLTDAQRKELHVVEKLPASLDEAVEALREDYRLRQFLGDEAVEVYMATKKGEIEFLGSMEEAERRQWVTERY